ASGRLITTTWRSPLRSGGQFRLKTSFAICERHEDRTRVAVNIAKLPELLSRRWLLCHAIFFRRRGRDAVDRLIGKEVYGVFLRLGGCFSLFGRHSQRPMSAFGTKRRRRCSRRDRVARGLPHCAMLAFGTKRKSADVRLKSEIHTRTDIK